MPAGRPTKYEERFIDSVDEYLKANQDEEFEFHKTRGNTSDSYEKKIKVRLPTIEGFALFLGVDKSTLYEWGEKYDQFSYALEKIITEQKKRLLEKGLSGDYNSTIAKLILSSNHGMSDKTDVTSGGEKITPILVKFLDAKSEDNRDTN